MNDSRQLNTILEVTDDLNFSGLANGGGIVRHGAYLHMSGQMNGRLVVEKGSRAMISGQHNGPVEVYGTLDVTGQINGPLHVIDSGVSTFATGSSVVRSGQTFVVNENGNFTPTQNESSVYVITNDTTRWLYRNDGTLQIVQ